MRSGGVQLRLVEDLQIIVAGDLKLEIVEDTGDGEHIAVHILHGHGDGGDLQTAQGGAGGALLCFVALPEVCIGIHGRLQNGVAGTLTPQVQLHLIDGGVHGVVVDGHQEAVTENAGEVQAQLHGRMFLGLVAGHGGQGGSAAGVEQSHGGDILVILGLDG